MPAFQNQIPVQPQRNSSKQSSNRILVVEDDRRMASSIAQFLCSSGWHATAADGVTDAIKKLGRHQYDFCILDGELPNNGSVRLSTLLRSMWEEARLIVFGTTRNQEKLQLLNADGFLSAPINDIDLITILDTLREQKNNQIKHRSTKPCSASKPPEFFGNSPVMREVSRVIERIAHTTATVLINGESGTGKSLLAREIHRQSDRAKNSLVEVACGSLTESLLESELFGHSAGAFTGATASRDGMFTRADRGTIFLDEIATATSAMQVKLLRVLQDFSFEPVGGSETKQVDARVILATHENLEELVCSGKFREDLFWRINVITIQLPPLRERREDIRPLAEQFLNNVMIKTRRNIDGFTDAAVDCLEAHHWPGNVRELVHAVERAAFLGSGNRIDATDFPPAVIEGARRREVTNSKDGSKNAINESLKAQLAVPERRLILNALRQHNWRRDAAAKALGINRATLYKKAKRLGVDLAQVGRTGSQIS